MVAMSTIAAPPRVLKQRRNLTFSPEAAAFLDEQPNASAVADAAVLEAMQAKRRHEALGRYVAELEAEFGPADPGEVARISALLRS